MEKSAGAGDGLLFTCTQCGNCCTGGPGYVWVEPEDLDRLAAHLGLSTEETRRRHLRRIGGRESLREVSVGGDQWDCEFLQAAPPAELGAEGPWRRRICAVYPARPRQCRTWPFWPENLASPEAWARAAQRCPGIGRQPATTPVAPLDGE